MATPKLRFKEFNEDWTLQNLGDSFSLISGYAFPSSASVDSGAKWLKIADVGIQEMTPNNPSYLPLEYLDRYSQFIVNKNDYVIALTRPILNKKLKIAKVGDLYDGALLNQRVAKIASINNNLDFIYSLLQKSKTVEELENSIAGTDPPNLSLNDVKEITLGFPAKEEQTKIASFLSNVDEKISQLTQKHELLSQYKQGMMQKLFSQQIRFKADDGSEFGEWERTTLGEKGTFLKGKGISKADIIEGGILPCIRYGELYTYYGEIISNVISATNLDRDTLVLSKANDVLIPASGETQIDIATASCVLDDDIALSGDLNIYRTKENGIFLSYMIRSSLKMQIAQLAQGNSVVHLYSSQLKGVELSLPCLEEQTKIANFLSAIDQKIEVVAQQIEQAKQWKKGLLQQMFV